MPDLGKAYVQIVPSAEGIKGSITSMLSGEASSAGTNAGLNIAASALKAFGGAAVGAKVAKEIGDGITDSVEKYADYEQLVGGVETLFKGSADTVKGYAENAYRTAGLSANDYMETVTSFSASLLQSLGGDTEEAARKADLAITDMADNANKMGTDITAIQNAYQGFAKQNYTMLDNLKLGYGGTKTEMERLLSDAEAIKAAHGEMASYSIDSYADIVDAIHVVQDEMGITGTTAQEASETISGSISTAKAAVDNLITGLADSDADLAGLMSDAADSALTVAQNVIPAIANVITAPVRLIGDLVDPANSMIRILGDVQEAQSDLSSANNIYDLTEQYFELRDRMENANLTGSELRETEQQLTSVREQLATMTDNAAIAQLGLGQALDDEIMKEQILAEEEQERANRELYEKLANGAAKYGEMLHEQQTLSGDLADAEERMGYARDQAFQGTAESAQLLTDAVEQLQSDLDDGLFDTSTAEGAAELESRLGSIEQLVTGITGTPVSFEIPQEVFDYIDELDLGILDTGDAFLDASEEISAYKSRLEELDQSTQEFQNGVYGLVRSGFIPASEGADMLGVSTEQLSRMMQAADQEALSAAIANGEFADSAKAATPALSEEAQKAKDTHDAIIDVASAAIDARYSGGDLREAYNDLSSELDKLRDEGTEYDIQLAEQKLAMLDLAATNQELVDGLNTIPGAMDYVDGAVTQMSQFLIDAGVSAADYASSVASMRDSVVNSYKVLVDESSITAEQMGEALSANLTTMQQWGTDLETLWAQAYADQDTAVMQYISYLSDLGPEYATAVHDFATGGYDELQSQAQDFAEVGELSAQYTAEGIAAKAYLAEDEMTNLSDEAIAAFEEGDFETPGKNSAEQMAQGIDLNAYLVSNAASNAVTRAYSEADSATGDFYWVGYAMDTQMASGISANASAVISAAKTVAKRAYEAAQEILKSVGKNSSNSANTSFIPDNIADLSAGASANVEQMNIGAYYMDARLETGRATGGSVAEATINNYFTISGTENPEDYANRLARQLKLQMRMA